jgi:hypothetical protein
MISSEAFYKETKMAAFQLPRPPEEKKSEATRLKDRIAAKQYILAQMGFNWQPDDDDVKAESEQLPAEGIVKFVPRAFVQPKEDFEPAAPVETPVSMDFTPFTPTEPVEDDGFVALPTDPFGRMKTKKASKEVLPPVETTSSMGGSQ